MTKIYHMVNTLARSTKRRILLLVDVVLVPPAVVGAVMLQFGGDGFFENAARYWLALPLLMGFGGMLTMVLGLNSYQLKAFESRAIGLTGFLKMPRAIGWPCPC